MEFEAFELNNIVVEGGETKWPTHCRNCRSVYPKELRGRITRLVTCENKDFLKAVSMSFLEIGITRYCCINNYKPSMTKNNIPKIVREHFREIRSQVFIDKTMTDWMDIKWDNDEVIPKNIAVDMISPVVDNSLSLFDL
jgi:hypothetical protein